MTKKICFGIFITATAAFLGTLWLTAATICGSDKNLWKLFFERAYNMLGAFFGILLLITFLSVVIAKGIVRPINTIDPGNPRTERVYDEMLPILKRLKMQNGKVNRYKSELIGSREQFSAITESMKEGIIIADPKTTILSCNTGAYRLMGAEPLTAGQSIYALSTDEPFRRCIQDAMGGLRAECLLKTDLGDRKIIASPAAVSDTLNGIVVFILDVTEEQALEKMRREFTSNVSHELKTPLTTIYGIADMLANGMVKAEDAARFGGDIRNEADKLITLINDIVALSKLDESDMPRRDEEVELYSLAAEVIERLRKAADEKHVTPKLIGEKVTVTGDPVILEEVLYNLCDNAIKYNREGGEYVVRVSHIPMKAVITVTDTGAGIPKDSIERIFERFYRADKSRSGKIKGTGLGLSIVKHGVGYHNGTVKAVSTDNGAVFIVELPIQKN